MAYESGARIGEILQLTVGDWRRRGARQEALACSKGSRGRRIKAIRFSSTTAKILLQYLNTDRASLDRAQRRLDELDNDDPLFLSRRRKPYSYEAFKPHWYKLCEAIGIDLNSHGLRHWYVTQEMHLISETTKSAGELKLKQEELVRYMAWRAPSTLGAYEHIFTEMRHADTQDQLHKKWYEEDLRYQQENKNLASQPLPVTEPRTGPAHSQDTARQQPDGWGEFLALGGMTHA